MTTGPAAAVEDANDALVADTGMTPETGSVEVTYGNSIYSRRRVRLRGDDQVHYLDVSVYFGGYPQKGKATEGLLTPAKDFFLVFFFLPRAG